MGTKLKVYPATCSIQRKETDSEYILRLVGAGNSIDRSHTFRGSYAIEWFNEKTKKIRHPSESTTEYSIQKRLQAAGKTYLNIQSLCIAADKCREFCRDIYGREVLYIRERFPCFDSYDYLHEDRYYHWFFIIAEGRLTRVYYEDETEVVYVTEDVECLEYDCKEQLVKWGYIDG